MPVAGSPSGVGSSRPWLDLEPQRGVELNPYVSRLAGRLYWASQESARRTMARYVADQDHDLIEAAQSAGAAAEYLLRALLCLHDPALLAARNHPASAIALSRANVNSALDTRGLRTISFGEALELVRLIYPATNIDSDFRFVMELRNAAAHMAMTDRESLKHAALRLVQIVSKVHIHLNRSEDDYWGDSLATLIRTMKDERATALSRTVEAKFTRARQVIAELTRELSPGDAEAVLIAREGRSVRWAGDDEEEHACPVCRRSGRLVVSIDRGDPILTGGGRRRLLAGRGLPVGGDVSVPRVRPSSRG